MDTAGHSVQRDDVVKIIDGPYKGKKGVIKHVHKQVLFLYNSEFSQTFGIFVEKQKHCLILGYE